MAVWKAGAISATEAGEPGGITVWRRIADNLKYTKKDQMKQPIGNGITSSYGLAAGTDTF